MISSDIINTDRFISLSLGARGLYMHLNCAADDDGFISSAIRTTRGVDGTTEMLDELVDAGYLIRFDSGIYLVRHWLLHNCLKRDRYTPTICTEERDHVLIVDKVYYLDTETDCIPNGSKLEPQISIDKDSTDKDKVKPKRTSFHTFEQNKYDFQELEKKLLEK